MPQNYSRIAKERARDSRKHPSVAESAMWDILRGSKLGFKFRREHPIGEYRLDFYCHEAMLCVEMDGEQHIEETDFSRDAAMSDIGVMTYRIPNRRFYRMDDEPFINDVRKIQVLCEERSGRSAFQIPGLKDPSPPTPSPPEERGGSGSA